MALRIEMSSKGGGKTGSKWSAVEKIPLSFLWRINMHMADVLILEGEIYGYLKIKSSSQ